MAALLVRTWQRKSIVPKRSRCRVIDYADLNADSMLEIAEFLHIFGIDRVPVDRAYLRIRKIRPDKEVHRRPRQETATRHGCNALECSVLFYLPISKQRTIYLLLLPFLMFDPQKK
jgi:hypothetical protein